MAIRTVVTRGFGNGTFNGTIPLVTLRGYISDVVVVPDLPGLEWSATGKLDYSAPESWHGHAAPDKIVRGWSAPDDMIEGWGATGKLDYEAPVED